MRVIIAGSRKLWVSTHDIDELVKQLPEEPRIILSGRAKGIDICGEAWANENGILIECYPPNYELYGPKKAPHVRNALMAANADALILIWNGKSSGSASMKEKAETRNLLIIESIR